MPIGAYLRRATALKGAQVYLFDATGVIVASRSDLVGVKTLAEVDPELARGLRGSVAGATETGTCRKPARQRPSDRRS